LGGDDSCKREGDAHQGEDRNFLLDGAFQREDALQKEHQTAKGKSCPAA